MSNKAELTERFDLMWPLLDERMRRIMAAKEAMRLGRGGISAVHRACGLSRKAIHKGIREIEEGLALPPGRIRREGAGRKSLTVSDPGLLEALEDLVDDATRGDPQSPLRWTCKSTRAIAGQLRRKKHPISHTRVAQMLHALEYSLQSNRKTEEGSDHPDRDFACGRWSCRNLPTKPAFPFRFVIFLPAPANGIKSSTASSPSFPPTGAESRCATMKPSSASSRKRPLPKG